MVMLEPTCQADAVATAVIGAALEVHRVLGPGFLESLYHQALAIELGLRAIPFQQQTPVAVTYKGHRIGEGRTDFIVGDSVIVELKTTERLLPIHQAQLLSYLKATGYALGLLINFHDSLLKNGIKRVVLGRMAAE